MFQLSFWLLLHVARRLVIRLVLQRHKGKSTELDEHEGAKTPLACLEILDNRGLDTYGNNVTAALAVLGQCHNRPGYGTADARQGKARI